MNFFKYNLYIVKMLREKIVEIINYLSKKEIEKSTN